MDNDSTSLGFLVDTQLSVEKLRVAVQVRNTHLKLNEREDKTTGLIEDSLKNLEDYIDGEVAVMIESHPAYGWFSQVKGIGRENIAKVIGLVDINKAPTISSLWKWAGMHVVDGKAPRRIKGQKIEYNAILRSMCWRLACSLARTKGKYYQYYLEQKAMYIQRYTNSGYSIVPAAKLPRVSGKRQETESIISLGHVDNMAKRKMIKLFLSHLWIMWRQAMNLEMSKPYAHEKLGHNHYYDPWDFVG